MHKIIEMEKYDEDADEMIDEDIDILSGTDSLIISGGFFETALFRFDVSQMFSVYMFLVHY